MGFCTAHRSQCWPLPLAFYIGFTSRQPIYYTTAVSYAHFGAVIEEARGLTVLRELRSSA